MAKTLEEYLKENPTVKIGDADMALGRQNFGALEGILKARKQWSQATTQEEKDTAHQTAENIRKAYGNYSGGVDGMEGKYSPTYHKPTKAAENSNVDALFEKYNNSYRNHADEIIKKYNNVSISDVDDLFEKYNNAYKEDAPTWTPKYEQQIQDILSEISGREGFQYDLTADPLYQQYRDQYIREGRRAMQESAAQSAALTGGYGSTYGATAAQQQYDNYLAGLNDKVPQLEQQAYSRYSDETAERYNRLGAYQTEENRLYGQYLDALGQYNTNRDYAFGALQAAYGQQNTDKDLAFRQMQAELAQNNTDRDFAFSQMQAAIAQNNYENEFDRNLFESDRNYDLAGEQWDLQKQQWDLQKQQQDIENALTIGDYSALRNAGYDTGYLDLMQELERAKARTGLAELYGLAQAEDGGGAAEQSSTDAKETGKKAAEGQTSGYTMLAMNYKLLGDTEDFEMKCAELLQNGMITQGDYDKFMKERKRLGNGDAVAAGKRMF